MSKTFMGRLVWSLALGLAAAAGAAFARPASTLTSDLEMGRDTFGRDEAVTVRWSLANDGADEVQVLRWRTPIGGFDGDLFEVRVNGHEATYLGKVVKWGAPRPEDFVRIPAGGAVTATFDLAAAYDMSEAGVYTVRYRAELLDFQGVRVAKGAAQVGPVRAWEAVLQIEDRGEPRRPLTDDLVASWGEAKTPAYVACSGSQQNGLSAALGIAETASTESRNHLTSTAPDSRYTTWFGAYDASRYSTVTDHFTKIASAFTNQVVTFHCDCTDSSYAYVYPTQPYNIWVCNAFWAAPAKGTDSRGGTLVHEMSHFNVTAGTNDYAYGQTAAKKLAQKTPRKAIANADNHEYYAEAGM
jgi:peptidyl-Lys metalloendopeptidase